MKAPIVKYSKKSYTPNSFCNIVYPYIGEIDINKHVAKVRALTTLKLLGVEIEAGF